ncbi:MAG: OFA family MFS transporter [Halobacteriaceae archaeon]
MGEDNAAQAKKILGYSRWWLIVAAAGMMAMVGPYQYVWTAIETPIANRLNVPLPQIGLVFTLFVIFQAGSQFPVGWWRDKHGPRLISMIAAVLAGFGYIGLAFADQVWQVYILYSLGAIGVGIVYTVAVNTALKWFPDRRGLTTGVGTMAFAGGSALFVPFVRANATVSQYPNVLKIMGVLIGIIVFIGALILQDPPDGWADTPSNPVPQTDPDVRSASFTWREMVTTWQFWLMYGMFVAMSGAGLMLTAKVVQFANNLGLQELIATLSATLLPIAGGIGRLLLGEISDRVDRKRAMMVSFLLCGLGLYATILFARLGYGIAFIGAVFVATFFWSPQYTLFPSIVGDYYGEKYSSANYALLYSGKMWGGVFGGAIAGWIVTLTSWEITFAIGGTLAVFAGVSAFFLRPPQ